MGSRSQLPLEKIQEDLERRFPNLKRDTYTVSSDDTIIYNCFAFVLGHTLGNLDPHPGPGNYWPQNITRSVERDIFIQVYAQDGFVPCDNGNLEEGFEKIAIYVDGTEALHASLQLPDGRWTSKLGQLEDIEHRALEVLAGFTGEAYGEIGVYLKRPRSARHP